MAIQTTVPGATGMRLRIKESAAGLAKEIFATTSTAGDSGGGEMMTRDLAGLRTSHKQLSALNGRSDNDTAASSSPRLPKALSLRQHKTSSASSCFRSPRYSPDLYSESEFEDELAGFLGGDGGQGVSPDSPLDLDLSERFDVMQREDLERNEEVFRYGQERERMGRGKVEAREEAPSSSSSSKGENLFTTGNLSNYGSKQHMDQEAFLESVVADMASQEDNIFSSSNNKMDWEPSEQEQHLNNHKTIPTAEEMEEAATNTAKRTQTEMRKQRALDRLRLLHSHLPALRAAEKAAVEASRNSCAYVDTVFNQLCHSEDSQDWAEFEAYEASLLGSDTQSFLAQAQHDAYLETMHHNQGLRLERGDVDVRHINHAQHILHDHNTIQTTPPQHREKKRDEDSAQEQMPEFHCPWIECHNHFEHMISTFQHAKTDNDNVLPCVHVGCGLEFHDQETWREHVFTAHHNLLPRQVVENVDMEGVWEKSRV